MFLITACFLKLFLNDRLISWPEGNNLLCVEQNGIRPGRKSTITKIVNTRKKMPTTDVSVILLKLTTVSVDISFGNNC